MLRLTLEKAREHGIEKVRICCDHYNVASAKTIRANGGVLEDECFDSSDGTLTQRYWIQNKAIKGAVAQGSKPVQQPLCHSLYFSPDGTSQ